MFGGLDCDDLLRCIHNKDLKNADIVADPCDAAELSKRAELVLAAGLAGLQLQPLKIRGNAAIVVKSTPHIVVLRALNQILRRATQIRPSSRDATIRSLATVLSEGVAHRVYKFDIESFFENVSTADLVARIANIPHIPRSAVIALESLMAELSSQGVRGLPRGMPLSATLSEIALQDFDRRISYHPEIYFHARYVDDIVLVTGAREDARAFRKEIRSLLPPGLKFNAIKTKMIELPTVSPGTAGELDYLGYGLRIHPAEKVSKEFVRRVDLVIAPKKVTRTKSRICCAVRQCISDGDINALERRIQMLSGNYKFRDFSSGKERSVGLYCNYRRLNLHESLHSLDRFLRAVLIGKHGGLAKKFSQRIPYSDRRRLLKYSFADSFKSKRYYNFTVTELTELRRCWLNA